MPDERTVAGEVFLQAVPQFRGNRVESVRIVKATQRRPDTLEYGAMLLKVRLRVPARVFDPIAIDLTLDAEGVEICTEQVPVPEQEASDA